MVYVGAKASIICAGDYRTRWYKEETFTSSELFSGFTWEPLDSNLYYMNSVVIESVEESHRGRYMCDSYNNKYQVSFKAVSELLVAST